jgi:hypothetical protein
LDQIEKSIATRTLHDYKGYYPAQFFVAHPKTISILEEQQTCSANLITSSEKNKQPLKEEIIFTIIKNKYGDETPYTVTITNIK